MGHQTLVQWTGIGLVSDSTLATCVTTARALALAGTAVCAPGPSPDVALDCAPGMLLITIIINSVIAYWTCRLAALGIGAVLEGGRRSMRSPSLMLMGFFIGIIVFAGIPGATAIAVLLPSTRSSYARSHRGRRRPLGVTSPRARVVVHLAGPLPIGWVSIARALSSWLHAVSPTAEGAARVQPLRRERVAMCGPVPFLGAQLDVRPLHPLLRSGAGRLQARDANGGHCSTTLARASSPGGKDQERSRRPRRWP